MRQIAHSQIYHLSFEHIRCVFCPLPYFSTLKLKTENIPTCARLPPLFNSEIIDNMAMCGHLPFSNISKVITTKSFLLLTHENPLREEASMRICQNGHNGHWWVVTLDLRQVCGVTNKVYKSTKGETAKMSMAIFSFYYIQFRCIGS